MTFRPELNTTWNTNCSNAHDCSWHSVVKIVDIMGIEVYIRGAPRRSGANSQYYRSMAS